MQKKLALYGITGMAGKWFSSYLSGRLQRCVVNGVMSKSGYLTTGVPQGSTLGPLLFLIYVNGLPNCLDLSIPSMYADDTQITAAAETVADLENVLNKDMENLNIWLSTNRLSANASKTEFMIIASNYRLKQLVSDPKIKINKEVINRVSKAKRLGILIDEKLTWEDHINDIIIPKVLKGLRMLRTVRPLLDIPNMVALYQALVLPRLDYCSSLWGNCGQNLKRKFQKLQDRAAIES